MNSRDGPLSAVHLMVTAGTAFSRTGSWNRWKPAIYHGGLTGAELQTMPELDDDAQVRDVYAHFGLAMYLSQCLEHGLANTLVFAKLLPAEVGRARRKRSFNQLQYEDRFDLFMQQRFKEVLGSLITLLREAADVPNDLEDILLAARDRRNFLAHHYFRERSEDFVSRVGRSMMIAELKEAQLLFEQTDQRLQPLVQDVMDKIGLQGAAIELAQRKYMIKAMAKASAVDAAFGADQDGSG